MDKVFRHIAAIANNTNTILAKAGSIDGAIDANGLQEYVTSVFEHLKVLQDCADQLYLDVGIVKKNWDDVRQWRNTANRGDSDPF